MRRTVVEFIRFYFLRATSVFPMKLVMYLGDDFIAAVPMDTQKVSQPGYLGSLKRELLQKNADVLLHASQEPDFLVLLIPQDFQLN
ncbi:MAG: hypothetical protein EOO10_11720 [Chitinophagaceae bacterium]|nr:MAG: hypothetical protein EOO10_11720 [Chitinophagaceae bacterium]